jgi:hypothetical protein
MLLKERPSGSFVVVDAAEVRKEEMTGTEKPEEEDMKAVHLLEGDEAARLRTNFNLTLS